MHRFLVPFRMQSTGWLTAAICLAIGTLFSGISYGWLLGGLLLMSLVLHEFGHMLAAMDLRVPVREFGLCMGGAYTRRAHASCRRHEIFIAAAGPAVNLVLVVLSLAVPHIGAHLAAGNLVLCVMNLVPLPGSDGLRILKSLCSASPAMRA